MIPCTVPCCLENASKIFFKLQVRATDLKKKKKEFFFPDLMIRSGSIHSELLNTQRCQKQFRPVLHISDKVTQSHIAIGKT